MRRARAPARTPRRTCRRAGGAAGRGPRRARRPSAIAGGRRRSRSAGAAGSAIQRPARRMRPLRGRPCRSSPSRRAQLGEDARLDGRVQPVAAVVDPQPGDLVSWPPAPPTAVGALEHAPPRGPARPRARRRRRPAGPAPRTEQVGRGQFLAGTAATGRRAGDRGRAAEGERDARRPAAEVRRADDARPHHLAGVEAHHGTRRRGRSTRCARPCRAAAGHGDAGARGGSSPRRRPQRVGVQRDRPERRVGRAARRRRRRRGWRRRRTRRPARWPGSS